MSLKTWCLSILFIAHSAGAADISFGELIKQADQGQRAVAADVHQETGITNPVQNPIDEQAQLIDVSGTKGFKVKLKQKNQKKKKKKPVPAP